MLFMKPFKDLKLSYAIHYVIELSCTKMEVPELISQELLQVLVMMNVR